MHSSFIMLLHAAVVLTINLIIKSLRRLKKMSIVRYDPFRELRSLQDDMNRLFVTAFPRTFDNEQMARGSWNPSVDISENEQSIVLEAELPGMKSEDVELSIENNVVTIRGERKFEKKEEKDNYHRVERSYGSFTRSFTLPRTVTGEDAQAEFQNGLLKVTLPKREEAKARKIEIKGINEPAQKEIINTTATSSNNDQALSANA
jgi:HSP20 family protein